MAIRVIYQVEAFTADGYMKARRFARNKARAEKISREYKGYEVNVRKLAAHEFKWVRLEDVEG